MSTSCHSHDHLSRDRRLLYIVLALNFLMFVLEIWQGLEANSTSLLTDAMDFLSDSFSYGVTLFVMGSHLHTRAKASLLKAGLMLALGAFALAQGIYHVNAGTLPDAEAMGWIGGLALAVNVGSAVLLYASRGRDSNMRSVWLCSRNDAFSNIMILIAAFAVSQTGTIWPDLIAAFIIAWLESSAALRIIRHARQELAQ